MPLNTRLTCFYEFFPSQRPFSGYLTITEFSFHMMWSRIIRYPPRQKAEMDNILRDLHNSLHHTKAKFNNFFRNISKFLTCYPLVDFLQILAFFLTQFQDINRCFVVVVVLSCFFHFLRSVLIRNSVISSSDSRERHMFFCVLVHSGIKS